MEVALLILLILAIAIIIYLLKFKKSNTVIIETNNNNKDENQNVDKKIPYNKKYLLTKNEWKFYKAIKPIADKLGYCILAKIRMADLVEVEKSLNKSEWQTYFNKINKKHIDFALCNPENLKIEILIELDDKTHENEARKTRDVFIEKVFNKTGYKLLRVTNSIDIENKIIQIANNMNTIDTKEKNQPIE